MPDSPLDEKDIRRILRRIEYEVQTVREEGFSTPNCWYALDRLKLIKSVCERALAGDKLASVYSFANESEAEAQYFDEPDEAP
jgi:hypothetical protein